jgi:hypothetical protein
MLPADADTRVKAIELIKQALGARGELSAEDKERMQRVVQIFGVNEKKGTVRNFACAVGRKEGPAKHHDRHLIAAKLGRVTSRRRQCSLRSS